MKTVCHAYMALISLYPVTPCSRSLHASTIVSCQSYCQSVSSVATRRFALHVYRSLSVHDVRKAGVSTESAYIGPIYHGYDSASRDHSFARSFVRSCTRPSLLPFERSALPAQRNTLQRATSLLSICVSAVSDRRS